MPEPTEKAAPAGDAPVAPAAPAASDGLPDLRQALDDFVAKRSAPAPVDPPASNPPAPTDGGDAKPEPKSEDTPAVEGEKPPLTAEAIKAALESGTLTMDDLIKTPGIDGRIGQMVQRLAQKKLDEDAALAERNRKYQLAEQDPDHPLSQELLREKQQLESGTQIAAVESQVFGRMVGAIGAWVGEKLPADLVKAYRETVAGQEMTLPDLVDRISALRTEHALKTEVDKRVQAELEAKWKDYQAERLGGEPSPQTSPAKAGGNTKKYTLDQIKDASPRDVYANFDEIVRSLAAA